jgi:hypothetical protein
MPRAERIALLSIVTCAIAVATVTAQQQVKRTPWGDPDLRGTWPSGSMIEVPFERPRELGTRAELTEAEFANFASTLAAQAESDLAESGPGGGATPPPHWLEHGKPSRQSSLVVDPPDGRLPPMTDDGARRAAIWRQHGASDFPVAGPEDLTPYDRCITRGVLGSTFPNIYSAGMEILQEPGYVIIRYEMIHETRIIPLDGRRHVGSGIRSYMGDARAHWDGATLVIETTNFNGRTGSFGRNANGNPTTDALSLVERYTLTGANTLQYRVTVDDPKTWTRPWTVSFPLQRDTEYKIFEYACHEGNYAMRNMLNGARVAEARAGQ